MTLAERRRLVFPTMVDNKFKDFLSFNVVAILQSLNIYNIILRIINHLIMLTLLVISNKND